MAPCSLALGGGTGPITPAGGALLVGVEVLAMIVMVGSAPMLQNVTQDKSQRIVETLLGAATPFELMTGKTNKRVPLCEKYGL